MTHAPHSSSSTFWLVALLVAFSWGMWAKGAPSDAGNTAPAEPESQIERTVQSGAYSLLEALERLTYVIGH